MTPQTIAPKIASTCKTTQERFDLINIYTKYLQSMKDAKLEFRLNSEDDYRRFMLFFPQRKFKKDSKELPIYKYLMDIQVRFNDTIPHGQLAVLKGGVIRYVFSFDKNTTMNFKDDRQSNAKRKV